jgi:predicted hydrolase (HD superfamily)
MQAEQERLLKKSKQTVMDQQQKKWSNMKRPQTDMTLYCKYCSEKKLIEPCLLAKAACRGLNRNLGKPELYPKLATK